MDRQDQLLQAAVKWQAKPRTDRTESLAKVLSRLMHRRIKPQHTNLSPVLEAWEQILPDQIRKHCKIVDISYGKIKLKVDSSSYKYELTLRKYEILQHLKAACPKARIKAIEFIIG